MPFFKIFAGNKGTGEKMNAAAKAFSLPFVLQKVSGVNAFLRRIRAAVGAFTPSVLLGVWGKAPMHKQKLKQHTI